MENKYFSKVLFEMLRKWEKLRGKCFNEIQPVYGNVNVSCLFAVLIGLNF